MRPVLSPLLALVLALSGVAQAGRKSQAAPVDLGPGDLIAAVQAVESRPGEDPVEGILRGMTSLGDFRVSGDTVKQALRELGADQKGGLAEILLGNMRDVTVTGQHVVIRNYKDAAHKFIGKDGTVAGLVYPSTQVSFDFIDRGAGKLSLANIKGLKVSKDVNTTIASMDWLELNRTDDRRWVRFQASGGPFGMFSETKEFDLPKPEPPAKPAAPAPKPLPKPLPLPPLEAAPLPGPDLVLGPPPQPEPKPEPTPAPQTPLPPQPGAQPEDPDVALLPASPGTPAPEPGRPLSPEEIERIIRDIERREAWRQERDVKRPGVRPTVDPQGKGIIKKINEKVPAASGK